MSAGRARELEQRRTVLLSRSAVLRERADRQAQALAPVLTWADRAQAAWRWLRERPPVLVGSLAVVAGLWVARRPSRLLTTPWRLWTVWRLWRRVNG